MKKMCMALSSLLLAGVVAAGAQETTAQTARPVPALTPLKVQVVLMRFNGERKISSMPYTLSVNATQRERQEPVSLRMGVQMPIPSVPAKDSPFASYSYRNIGTNIDCWAMHTQDGRFNISLSVEQSSIYGDEAQKRAGTGDQPVFRSFNSSFHVILKDGATTQYVSATDPVSGEVLKIDVTVNVVK